MRYSIVDARRCPSFADILIDSATDQPASASVISRGAPWTFRGRSDGSAANRVGPAGHDSRAVTLSAELCALTAERSSALARHLVPLLDVLRVFAVVVIVMHVPVRRRILG